MNIEDYIARIISKIDKKATNIEQLKELEEIYNELGAVGYSHQVVFTLINKVIADNLKKLGNKLKTTGENNE